MSTAVVAAGAAAGAAEQPAAGISGGNVAATSKPWWRNALVVVWLLFVYGACLMQAINTMVALNAQQEISSIVTPDGGGSATNGDTDASASSAGNGAAKTQLEGAMRLRDEMGAFYGSSHGSETITNNGEILVGWNALDKKFDALEQKFRALPPEIQKAAIEAEAGVGWQGINYVFMPMAMVTLMMSLWMGALGGAIHMTVEFLKTDETKSGAWYLFRPFLGALLALAVFIIFQAGQIVLTNPKPEGNAGLNPYVIAFVAIVSGMLADQAYRRIGLVGSQFLDAKADANTGKPEDTGAAEASEEADDGNGEANQGRAGTVDPAAEGERSQTAASAESAAAAQQQEPKKRAA